MRRYVPTRNFEIQVERQWDPSTPLDEGVYDLRVLQARLHVGFIPSVQGVAPPWTDPRQITNHVEARLAQARGRFTVTPNDQLAGHREQVRDEDALDKPITIFYCSNDQFGLFVTELESLCESAPDDVHHGTPVDDLGTYQVIAFVKDRILNSELLLPEERAMLMLD